MTRSWETLLDGDWSDTWETLPEAPPLVPRSKAAQITLRLPPSLIARMKAVGATKSLPYHSLARAWIVDALRSSASADSDGTADEPQADQLNIKLDQDVLDQPKIRAHELHRPYHRLARDWIESALAREEESLGIDASPAGRPPIKDLMALLLHTTNKRGDAAVRGITQLQKLLFVIEEKLGGRSNFYAFNYGPFNEDVNDAADALRVAGFLGGTEPAAAGPPSFAHMMATVVERTGPREEREREEFALNDQGHEAAERLRHSSRAYEQLYAYVQAVREEWDTQDLLDRVYEAFPQYAERSLIRQKVAERTARLRSHRK